MKSLILRIKDISTFNQIQDAIDKDLPLSSNQRDQLSAFLDQIPLMQTFLFDNTPLDELVTAVAWDTKRVEDLLKKWIALFNNIPGYNYCPCALLVSEDDLKLLNKKVIMTAAFAPSLAYNLADGEGYEVQLKDDGAAVFWLPTLEDAEQYPELYNFKGTWKEAYLLLLETLRKGWPMEEFPEELQKFLPKQ